MVSLLLLGLNLVCGDLDLVGGGWRQVVFGLTTTGAPSAASSRRTVDAGGLKRGMEGEGKGFELFKDRAG